MFRNMKFLFTKAGLFLTLYSSTFLLPKPSLARKIVLIQNAEPDEHDANSLSIAGEARSICLNELVEKEKSLTPQIIYAQNPQGDVYTPLPLQTVQHLASKLNIEINDTFKERQQAKLASTIENLPDDIETVLLCWTRYQIELLVRTLGIDDPPTWNDGYDNLWIVEDDHLTDTTQNLGSCIHRVKAELANGIPSRLSQKHWATLLLFPFTLLFLRFYLL